MGIIQMIFLLLVILVYTLITGVLAARLFGRGIGDFGGNRNRQLQAQE